MTFEVSGSTGKNWHNCGASVCKICRAKLVATEEHQCYIQPLAVSTDHPQLVFYDFETFADDNGKHVPFLVCTKSTKGIEKSFYGLDCVKSFLLYFRKPRFTNNLFIGHNMQAYNS